MALDNRQARRQLAKKHVDKKLIQRLLMYFIMSLAILGFVIYEIVISSIYRWIAGIAIIIWFWLGLLTHRMFLIYRHEDDQKVLSRVDRLWGTILIIYILFSIFRKQIIGYFFHGPAILAVTMALVFGLMLGRVIGMRNKIIKILKKQDILE